jgi:hypothetical protein
MKIGKLVFLLLIGFFLGGYKLILSPVSAAPMPVVTLNARVLAMPQVGPGGPPPGPNGTPHQVTLDCTASVSGGVTGYNFYRAIAATGPFGKITTSTVSTCHFVDGAVTPGVTEFYQATAVASANESGPSNTASAAIPSNPNPPTALAAAGQ